MNKHVTIGQLETALKKSRLSVAELSEAIIEALEEVAAKSDSTESDLSEELSKKQTAGESVKINSEEKIIFSTDYSYTENLLDSDGNEILDSNEESILSNGPIEEADEPNVIFDKETSTLIIDGKQFSLKLKTEGEIAFEAENITASSITINGVNVWDKLTELEDRIAFLETDADTNPYYDVDI